MSTREPRSPVPPPARRRTTIAALAASILCVTAAVGAPTANASANASENASANASEGSAERAAEGAAVLAIRGGATLYSGAARCTVAFNVRDHAGATYGLTDGRCVASAKATTWYADPGRTVPVGSTDRVSFPARNFALIRYTNPDVSYPGEVGPGGGGVIDVVGAASPVVGQSLCRVGEVAGWHCGTVQAVNVSVGYPEGAVTGLFRASLCQEAGSAGGAPAISGNTALGITVGGSGDCRSGGTTYLQPVITALAETGTRVY
ncbi:S1 family peptidase [Streptomyces sp. NPDC003077]|uniref:S1 family peptidase n=1 Tax=Streptomyces sp. NPDC003077 TaxID=3154443 RepID=UPI0033B11AA3